MIRAHRSRLYPNNTQKTYFAKAAALQDSHITGPVSYHGASLWRVLALAPL